MSVTSPEALPAEAVTPELTTARAMAQDAAMAQRAAFDRWQAARAEEHRLKHRKHIIPELLSTAGSPKEHAALTYERDTLPRQIQGAEVATFDLDADRQYSEAELAEAELAVRRLELDAWNTLAAQVTEALRESETDGIEATRASVGYSPVGHRRAIEALRLAETVAVNRRADAARARSAASSARFERGL